MSAKRSARRPSKPSAKTLTTIERNVAALPDLPDMAAESGTIGNVFYDDANVSWCSRCIAKSAEVPDGDDDKSLVLVDIDINAEGFAHVQVNSEMHFASDTRQHLNLSVHQLEPLSVAIAQAVQNARVRGFLRPTSNGAAT